MAQKSMRQPPNRLATFDIATSTGVAWGPLSGWCVTDVWPLPKHDPDDTLAARVAALENTTAKFLARECIDIVVIAARFPGKSQAQVSLAYALDSAVRVECWRQRIPLRWQSENTVRYEMFGYTGTRDVMKAQAMAWCRHHNIAVKNDDAADAAVLWAWTRNELVRKFGRKLVAEVV